MAGELAGRLQGAWTALWSSNGPDPRDPDNGDSPTDALGRWTTEKQRIDVLDAYENNNRLYRRMSLALRLAGYAGYQGYRNPANRIASLYSAKLTDKLIDSLDTGGDERLKDLILKGYEWSNWVDRSEEAARDLAVQGYIFVKVETVGGGEDKATDPATRVQRNVLDNRTVSYYETDGRDILTYLRLDVPYLYEVPGTTETEDRCVTEVWDKEAQSYRMWDHDLGDEAPLLEIADTAGGRSSLVASAVLGAEAPEGQAGADVTGYDFIPVVFRRLRGGRGIRGRGVFEHALDAIDEINRQATKLTQMMFPDVYSVYERDPSARGGDLPAPYVEGESTRTALSRQQQNEYRVVDTEGMKNVKLPSGVRQAWRIPPIDFTGHIAAMENFTKEAIEKDIPELAYYRLREMGDVSGRAAIILMADVTDRLGAARRKFEDMEVRLNKMALTIGKVAGVEGFDGVGEYEDGALDHRFKPYSLFPVSKQEQAEEGEVEARAIAAMQQLPEPVFRRFLEKLGYEGKDVETILAEAVTPEARAATSILGAVKGQRGGAPPGGDLDAPPDTPEARARRFTGTTGDLVVRPAS